MEKFIKGLERDYKELISFTQSLVRVNSVNGNETEMCGVIKDKLKEFGVKSKTIGKKKDRLSLIARIRGQGKKTLMMCGHTDTVPVGDISKWRYGPFSARVVNGKLYGRGSDDQKAGIAAAVFAVKSLLESNVLFGGDIVLVFNSDEEGGAHTGIKEVLGSGIRADACIVTEPMGDGIIRIGSRGMFRFEIIVKGRSAHVAIVGAEGSNAVLNMSRVLLALEKIKPKAKKHKLFPQPKITPGTLIQGGTAINVVPDACRASVDCRLGYAQKKSDFLGPIKKEIEKLKSRYGFGYMLKELFYAPPFIVDENEEIVKAVKRSITKVFNRKSVVGVSGGLTDASLIVPAGIPCVIAGTSGGNKHSENEFVYTRSILNTAKVYALSIFDYLV